MLDKLKKKKLLESLHGKGDGGEEEQLKKIEEDWNKSWFPSIPFSDKTMKDDPESKKEYIKEKMDQYRASKASSVEKEQSALIEALKKKKKKEE